MQLVEYSPKPWKAPRAVKIYAPKPLAPGQVIEYTSDGETRTGTVWSVADSTSALYVLPDSDPMHPVYVRRAGKRDYGKTEGAWYEVPGQADADRANVLRAEIIRNRGIYPVYRTERAYRALTDDIRVTWHSDPSCPRIAEQKPYSPADHVDEDGKPLHAIGYTVPGKFSVWSPIEVALTLTRHGQASSELCPDCIVDLPIDAPTTTEEPAEEPAEEEVTQDNTLRVVDVETLGGSTRWTLADADGTAAYVDTFGSNNTLRVLWGGRTLTEEFCALARATVESFTAHVEDQLDQAVAEPIAEEHQEHEVPALAATRAATCGLSPFSRQYGEAHHDYSAGPSRWQKTYQANEREVTGMKIGYARVSTNDQHPEAQGNRLTADGCELVFTDHGVSGAKSSRPEWDKALAHLRKGDTLVVTKLDRMGRSVKNLVEVAAILEERGVNLRVLDQSIDTSTPTGRMLFTILAGIAEFERELIRERTRDGLAATKARGREGGRKARLNSDHAELAKRWRGEGISVSEIGVRLGKMTPSGKPVSRQTVYRALGMTSDS